MSLTSESMTPADLAAITGGNRDDFGGGNGWWIILFFILAMNGGWGFGGFGGNGMGAVAADGAMLYPWMNQSNQINDGFRDQMLNTSISGIQNSITSGFGDVQNALCGGFAGVNASVTGAQNALAQQMYTNQIADLERSFASQTANMQGFNGVNTGVADLKYTVATEACADRSAISDGVRDVIANQTANTQAVLDKLCALELDGVKSQLAQAERENLGLQNQLNMATMQASQTAQTAQILAGQAAEIDGVYNRLKNCPVPSMPVYGSTPIFTCNGNNGGCGCGSF